MVTGAACAVTLYTRSQRPAWVTLGAGARIGLVTGLIGAWIAFGVSGIWLFVERVFLHQAGQIDAVYKAFLDAFEQKAHESMASMSATDAAQLQAMFSHIEAWLTPPEGHAGVWAFSVAFNCAFLVLFAVAGGALGARMLSRRRQTEI
jgi:hypothetical protein